MHYVARMRDSTWRWAAWVVLATCASASMRASAACVEGAVELLWSYPAEGDSDVPTNAQLQLVLSAKLHGSDWDATLNGEPVTPAADGVFSLGSLAADTEYTFRIEGHQQRVSITTKVVELHFRTGSGTADAVEAPVVVGASPADKDDAALCARVDARYVCRDTVPADVREIELDAPNAVALGRRCRQCMAARLLSEAQCASGSAALLRHACGLGRRARERGDSVLH